MSGQARSGQVTADPHSAGSDDVSVPRPTASWTSDRALPREPGSRTTWIRTTARPWVAAVMPSACGVARVLLRALLEGRRPAPMRRLVWRFVSSALGLDRRLGAESCRCWALTPDPWARAGCSLLTTGGAAALGVRAALGAPQMPTHLAGRHQGIRQRCSAAHVPHCRSAFALPHPSFRRRSRTIPAIGRLLTPASSLPARSIGGSTARPPVRLPPPRVVWSTVMGVRRVCGPDAGATRFSNEPLSGFQSAELVRASGRPTRECRTDSMVMKVDWLNMHSRAGDHEGMELSRAWPRIPSARF